MIKNIVFDMGNVLTEYEPDLVCAHFIKNDAMKRRINQTVFISPEWVLLDMGVISEEAALKRILYRLDSEEERDLAALCFEQWHLYNMHPKAGMDKVVRELKERGFGLYVCSNASLRLPACSGRVIPEAQLFDGMLFSAQVKCMKPQKEMYGHLFSMFRLKPEECFFVDDWDLNIEGAAACGMRGYCFEDGNVEKLRQVLAELK